MFDRLSGLRALTRVIDWFFAAPSRPVTPWAAFLWWEKRRIPFNIVIGIYGCFCLTIFLVAIGTSGHLEPGEDAVEPMALILAPFGINALYTLGWLVEVPMRLVGRDVESEFGPLLLQIGLGLGIVLISIPAVLWGGYRLLQLLGVAS